MTIPAAVPLSETLLSAMQLGDLLLKNRVALAPLTRSRAGTQRLPNELMAAYYAQRASAGLLITEATVVSDRAFGWMNSPGIYEEQQIRGWKLTTDAVHKLGTPIFMQLWHCGRASHRSFFPDGRLPVAPSAIKIQGDHSRAPAGKVPYEEPRALETAEISGLVEDYRQAAVNAKNAGFDGVEIHAANGYLIDQFLQSKTNHRTDSYGGSVENRYRFLREIVEAILTVWPSNRVAVRISPNGVFNDMGSPDYRETFTYVASQLDQYNLAYLHIIDGLEFGFHRLGEAMTLAEFRAIYQGVLMGNCGYTKDTAAQAIQRGDADLIAFGRPFISNPDLVDRFANDWPLNPPAPMEVWYSFEQQGYADFQSYRPSQS